MLFAKTSNTGSIIICGDYFHEMCTNSCACHTTAETWPQPAGSSYV